MRGHKPNESLVSEMALDFILFLLGSATFVAAAGIGVFLISSRKRVKGYSRILETESETETFNASSLAEKAKTTAFSIDASQQETALIGETITMRETLASDPSWYLGIEKPDEEGEIKPIRIEKPEGDPGHTGGEKSSKATISIATAFDDAMLDGRYVIESEISGGSMSRVFIARSAKLGNRWIVKYIPKRSSLENEADILKLLNHPGLPQIVDIFHGEKGVCLVESYIEGGSLRDVLDNRMTLSQGMLLNWLEQAAQALNYMHQMRPQPIYHLDLKPSNIMLTHDNRLVLIDFGISRQADDSGDTVAVTYAYAAPEQMKKKIPERLEKLIASRFGTIPPERVGWPLDARTDIFSLGAVMFELATGTLPTMEGMGKIHDHLSKELADIIIKCMETNPADRYQSTSELLSDIKKAKLAKMSMARAILARKVAAGVAVVMTVSSFSTLGGGYYVYAKESSAILSPLPQAVVVSLQQTAPILVEKRMADGTVAYLNDTQIKWELADSNIARVDAGRVSGLNVGWTELFGLYRNKEVSLEVKVVPPLENLVDISQWYKLGGVVESYAGTAEREWIDGAIASAEFVSPESVDVSDNGTIYIADSGQLRRITGGVVESVDFKPEFLSPHMVRCFGDDAYILTDPWQGNEEYRYALIKLGNGTGEGEAIYSADATYTSIEDFDFGPDGVMYAIERNAGVRQTYLKIIDHSTREVSTVAELDEGASALAVSDDGLVYIANSNMGTIQVFKDGTLENFAGLAGERAFIDGQSPRFYMPQRIRWFEDCLLIWDFNTLRRIDARAGVAGECETLAGVASPDASM
ncbi:MAG: protein kinase, partial [Clostridiales bacterium]|nr:protein kinase [Clostridiales bacterium]